MRLLMGFPAPVVEIDVPLAGAAAFLAAEFFVAAVVGFVFVTAVRPELLLPTPDPIGGRVVIGFLVDEAGPLPIRGGLEAALFEEQNEESICVEVVLLEAPVFARRVVFAGIGASVNSGLFICLMSRMSQADRLRRNLDRDTPAIFMLLGRETSGDPARS